MPISLPDDKLLHFHYLQWLCLRGWDSRHIPDRVAKMATKFGVPYDEQYAIYKQRLARELRALFKQGFVDYILIVYDLINWCRTQDIMVGPGRGSSAGSLVCFLTKITAIDPIEHDLLFERFINPNRIDMPDIDMDFEDVRREEVIQYLYDRYGEANVSQIATVAVLKGKSCLKDVARVFEVPYDEVNAVTSSIIERSSGDERASQCIEDSFKEFKVCQDFNKKYPMVLKFASQLEGQARQTGIHAAGVVTSPVPITDIVPVEARTVGDKRVKVAAIDYWGIGALGLLKLDVLGLRTLTVIHDALKAIKERHGVDIDMERLELDDTKVFEHFTEMHFAGIFQFDSISVEKICERVTFTSFEDITAINALNRPGTMRSGLATKWAERKMGRQEVESIHPLVDKITEHTLGIIVYQEQVTRIFQDVGGYDPGTADSLRKKVAKKEGEEAMGRERGTFVAGAVDRGVPAEVAGDLMDKITFFGSYGFNKSHAAAYGAISYWGMWLKAYYPAEFIWSLLKNEPDRQVVAKFVKEARRLGCDVRPPDVNRSGSIWQLSGDKTITTSLVDIKGVGTRAAEDILSNQPYSDFADFLERVNRRVVHRGVICALAKAGAMKCLLRNTRAFLEHAEDILGRKPGPAHKRYLELSEAVDEYSEDDLFVLQSDVCPISTGKHPLTAYEDVMASVGDHVKWESMAELNWDERLGYVRGVIVEVKYNQVGDFHTVEPDEEEKARIGWGKRYANVNVEDESGTQQRIKVDIDIFEDFRHIIDKGIGTCIALCVSKASRSQTMRACYLADLEDMRLAHKEGKEWTGPAAWFKQHPVLACGGAKANLLRLLAKKTKREGDIAKDIVVWVLYVREHVDKKGNLMAFFDMGGALGSAGGLCFGSSYPTYKGHLRSGTIVKMDLVRGRKGSWILDADAGCQLEVLSNLSGAKR